MIIIKNEEEIQLIRHACNITKNTLELLRNNLKVGISTKELDDIANKYIISQGGQPAFKGIDGFPATICTSVNNVIVHGIPSKDCILKNGDIISIDVGVKYNGYNSDSARTYAIGNISPKLKKLIKVTELSFYEGLKGLKSGCVVGDISSKIQKFVEKNSFSIVRELGGHGVGKQLHEEPLIPNYGKSGFGPKLNTNCVIAVEPMVNMGSKDIKFMENEITIVTLDGLPSSHYENTILVTENGYEILT